MNLPISFVEQTKAILGNDFEAFLQALQDETPVSIRINKEKNTPDLPYQKVAWCNTGYYLPERPNFTLDPLLHAGAYYVQEASSMFLEQVVKQQITEPVVMLDLCAAPGGKSTHLSSLLPKDSLLVSNEYVRSRSFILSENLQKWGNPNSVVCNNTPKDLGKLSGLFDAILVDAPCSGEGMFRKDPNAITEWSEQNVQTCVARQRELLGDVWDALKAGGTLIYSTCTYNRHENEETVQWIINELGAELISIKMDERWGITPTDSGYRFYPHKTRGEGFFMSALRKTGETQTTRIKPGKQTEKLSKEEQGLKKYLIQKDDFLLSKWKEKIIALPDIHAETIFFLLKKLNTIHAGITLGEWKGKSFIPDAALALSTQLNKDECVVADVDWRTALSYLRTENIVLPDADKRLVLITYRTQPLGWVKNLGNRCNSLFPNEWRIRMNIPNDAVENSFYSC